MAFSTCCCFKCILPASRAGAIIQLLACNQVKPSRLVHLHKRQPRGAHMQKHTRLGAHRHNFYENEMDLSAFLEVNSVCWCCAGLPPSNQAPYMPLFGSITPSNQHISTRTPKLEAFKCEAPAKESTLGGGGVCGS